MMRTIESLAAQTAQDLDGILFDIDDTFSLRGKIPAEAYQALWDLNKNGLKVAPITGRPAGWCDHIARMWPVDGVVGENGAFYFWFDQKEQKLLKRFRDPADLRAQKRERLMQVKHEILASVPGAALASDQLYREADLAIDYCEDVPPLSRDEVGKICAIFKKHGAVCKVSSIHVNGWFGDYNKLQMTQRFVQEHWGLDLDQHKDRFLFCGDSPNDEPMFAYFPHSVGVKNILHFVDQLKYPPAYVASFEGGEGFAEIAAHILRFRTP